MVITLFIGSSLQCGWVLAENSQVGFILDKKLGWKAAESKDLVNYNTLTTMLGLVGLSIGSLLGGNAVPRLGVWRTLLVCNFLNMGANGIKLILSTPAIFIGRILFGIFVGMQTMAFTIALNESVPGEFL